jgi:hypothetical protein
MINSIILFMGLWLLEKLAEKALDKFLDRILSDRNLKHLDKALKLQVLVLYLDWLLQKTALQDLPVQPSLNPEPAQPENPVT